MNGPHEKDYYRLLEVSPQARPTVIQAAYKALMREYHPDTGADGRIAKDLNEAKDTLLDSDKRKAYDKEETNLKGKTIGNYRVLKLIAEGGFGKTYKGEHTLLKTPVCLKHGHKISPQYQQILMEEARAIWDLRHYGIPAIRDLFTLDDGSPILVMSYVPGPTLEQIVQKVRKLDPEDLSWIVERSLNILKYLHYQGVVHGDVKPQNIIVQPDTHHVVLVDYGLSAIRPAHDSESKGYTPYFASPEQEHGKALLPESDFYGLGMTMVYALGGDIARKQVPDTVPDDLCMFIKRLLVKDVLSRPSWDKEDLFETFQKIRTNIFGRHHSGMKKIKGWKDDN